MSYCVKRERERDEVWIKKRLKFYAIYVGAIKLSWFYMWNRRRVQFIDLTQVEFHLSKQTWFLKRYSKLILELKQKEEDWNRPLLSRRVIRIFRKMLLIQLCLTRPNCELGSSGPSGLTKSIRFKFWYNLFSIDKKHKRFIKENFFSYCDVSTVVAYGHCDVSTVADVIFE